MKQIYSQIPYILSYYLRNASDLQMANLNFRFIFKLQQYIKIQNVI